MTSVNRIGLVLAAFVMLGGARSQAQIPIQDIQLFNSVVLPKTSTPRVNGPPELAIDNDTNSFSYLTPSYAIGDRFAGLDFGSPATVNRLQVQKYANIDGAGSAVDPMDLQLLYTTDAGPLIDRQYQPVSGLTNGYLGTELITADSVNAADATVNLDTHEGVYSLSFNSVSATGLALRYRRDPSGDYIENYYPTAEFKPMNGTTPQAVSAIDIWRPEMPVGSVNVARGTMYGAVSIDQTFAIDGDTNTWTYLTRSYTDHPTGISLDLGSATSVNRIRVNKVTNLVTGSGIVEPMDVQILYTTDTGPLNERTYHPVSGLTSGFNGAELINATGVDSSTATVHGEIHQFPTDGWFSLTFNEVTATAIEYVISKPEGSANQYINYPIAEFELYHSNVIAKPGDFDHDGDVDGVDFLVWQRTLGDAATLAIWKANYGMAASPATQTVPEPGSAILFTLAGMIAVSRRESVRR